MSVQPKHDQITGKHVAIVMVAFFAVIVAVNFTMAGLATSSWTGLVVKNSYVASQGFNQELEKARVQSALGWTSRLVVEPDRIVVHLTDRNGEPALLPQAELVIGRPAFEQMDRVLKLVHQGSGLYAASVILDPGLWMARLESTNGDQPFRQDFRFTVKEHENDS